MLQSLKLFFLVLCCIPAFCIAQPQPPVVQETTVDSVGKVVISAIHISGNKKTKAYIIEREMKLKKGDSVTLDQLIKSIEQSRQLIYNTTLFTEVTITPQNINPQEVIINVGVKEKWYIYPTPQFQLVDRNFNEWLKVYHADFNRVIYGAKFAHYNLSGRGDQLRIYLLNGYARNFSFSYRAPYSNAALTEGFAVSAGYTQNREISYKTSLKNKLLQYRKEDAFVRNIFSGSASYFLRRGFYKRHSFSFVYTQVNLDDSIITAKYNPQYFNEATAVKGYPDFIAGFQYVNTNNVNYPLKGKAYSLGVLKRGLGFKGGINMLQLDAALWKYFPHSNNWYSAVQVATKIKLPFTQAYINQRAFGYGDLYLRGLEYYVIDGVAAMLAKYTLKKKIISFNIPVPFKIKAIPKIPVTIFAKTYGDAGYNYNKPQLAGMLNNKLIYTGGFGLDILTLYDINMKLEYSFNQLGENGLFLHVSSAF
ncbi:MAG: hypothetical protein JWQ27_2641 [Ferruginibacter sp.]|nr:hypothetical protein [Ferruginibacter sp.]